ASLDVPGPAFAGVLSCDGTVVEAEAGPLGGFLWECCPWPLPPAARAGLRDAVARAAGGERVCWETQTDAAAARFELVPLRGGGGEVARLLCRAEGATGRRPAEPHGREARMLAGLEASRTGIYLWNLRDDTVEQDESIRHLVGGAPIASARDYLARLHPDDRDRLEAALRRCAETGADLDLEYRIIGPDGQVRWLADRGRMVHDEAGRPLCMTGACTDVTARKETESRLRLLMEAGGIASFDWNLVDDTAELSETWWPLFGLPADGRVPTFEEWLALLHPDDRGRIADGVSRALAGAPYRSEYRTVWPCGEIRWLATRGLVEWGADGRPVRLYGMIADVTERRRWEEQLREAQEIAELGRWEFDVATGRIAWSDEVFRLFGRDPALGPPSFEELRDLLHPDDRPQFDALVRAALERGEGFDVEWRARRPDGTHRWKRTRARAFRDAGGKVARIVGTDFDVDDRKEAEQALRASEERLKAVVETAVDGIVTMDAQGGIATVNSAVERLFGHARDELVGQNVRVLMPEPYRSGHDGYLARYHATKERRIIGIGREVTGRRKDGSTFPMYLSVGSFEHEGRTFFTGIIGDLTEQRRTRTLNERLGRIVEDSASEVYVFDAETLRFVRVNRGARQNLGYTMDELEGLTPLDLTPTFTRERLEALMAPLRAGTQERVAVEAVHRRKDGSTYDVEVQLQLMRGEAEPVFFAAIRDVTERRRQQEALRESERQFELLANSIPQLAWMARPDGAIYWYNERWFDYTGTTLDEMRGEGWRKVHHPDHLDRVLSRLRYSWETGVPWEDTFPLRGRDGGYRWFLSRARPVYDTGGRIARWFGTNTDVTEQRRAEEALRELADQREALLKEAHHRIKNSIASVASLLHLQANAQPSDAARAPLLDAMRRVHTIGRIHEALYRSDRYDAIDVGAHLHAIMADLAGTVSTRGGRSPSMRVRCPAGVRLPAETVTPLSLIAVELVLNAVKHAGTEEELAVDVSFEAGSPQAGLPMRLEVSDNGPGLPPGAEAGARGLGLRLVRSLARQLGGHVSFEDRSPEGGRPGTLARLVFAHRSW
ncbi:PAS domain S-box protein, partial [Arenibaculum sp.]|uniref:PAS domain S-box protein n=1 Tax=Arenibaculum sp. TaxID=2865862 RepID=UPI002E0E5932|nr:PAS domain S-box protein [Arenibaculum sp.]